MLIILSGPPAAGKSSVGEALALRFPKSAYFSVDTLRHFVKGSYVEPWNDTDDIGQSTLATTIAKDMIKQYLDRGFTVIIDDVIDDNAIAEYQTLFPETYGFLLLPSLDTVRARDLQRPKEIQMGDRIDAMHQDLTAAEHPTFK